MIIYNKSIQARFSKMNQVFQVTESTYYSFGHVIIKDDVDALNMNPLKTQAYRMSDSQQIMLNHGHDSPDYFISDYLSSYGVGVYFAMIESILHRADGNLCIKPLIDFLHWF